VSTDPWGRVGEDGTVYVRTPEGERAVGSWQAGTPEEALSYFRRKYDALALEVDLLERRIRTTDLSTEEAKGSIGRLRGSVTDAHAVGDLAALQARLDALSTVVEEHRQLRAQARVEATEQARAAKGRLVEEAEQVATGSDWRAAGDRLRALVDEWKALPRLDRRTDDDLWHRFSAARSAFGKRRRAHFAELEERRGDARARKERLVAEAESLAGSTEWGPTAAHLRDLMQQWKAAGGAGKGVEDELWSRFRAAQDSFFAARSAQFAERDTEQRDNLAKKEALAAEAERLLPITDLAAAKAALRSVSERWEQIGHVPREARHGVESRLARVEQAVRDTEERRWRRSNPEARARAEATVTQLRASIAGLEADLEKAHAAGDARAAADAEAALQARRSWLTQAEKALAEFSG
jgi:hypothetical protein